MSLQEDFIGLKELDRDGRITLKSFPGVHMQFSFEDFEREIIWPYLAGKVVDS